MQKAGHRSGELQHPELQGQRRHHRKHGHRQRGADSQKRPDRQGQRPARHRHRHLPGAAGGQRRQGRQPRRRSPSRTRELAVQQGGHEGAGRYQDAPRPTRPTPSSRKTSARPSRSPGPTPTSPAGKRKPSWPRRKSPSKSVSWTPRSRKQADAMKYKAEKAGGSRPDPPPEGSRGPEIRGHPAG